MELKRHSNEKNATTVEDKIKKSLQQWNHLTQFYEMAGSINPAAGVLVHPYKQQNSSSHGPDHQDWEVYWPKSGLDWIA